jgi:hypothetical protein
MEQYSWGRRSTINDYAMTDNGIIARDIAIMKEKRDAPLVVELAGNVDSVARPRLRGTIRTLRACGVGVAIRTVPEIETAKFLRDCGAEYLCLNVAQAKAAGLGLSALYAFFTIVAREIGGLGFRLCLWNAAAPADSKRTIGLGFTIFSGTPVGPTGGAPLAPAEGPAQSVRLNRTAMER